MTVVMQEYQTRRLVFGQYDRLSYGHQLDVTSGHRLDTSPRSWYQDQRNFEVVQDRWVYVFSSYLKRATNASIMVPMQHLLFEIYVDSKGFHWRTDEKDLTVPSPNSLKLKYTKASFREQQMEKRRKSGTAATSFSVLPHYVDGQKANHWVFISPFPLPSESINELNALNLQLPWAVVWGNDDQLHANVAGTRTVEVAEESENGTEVHEVPVDVVLGVDPVSLAIGTNRQFQRRLKSFRKKYATESERVAFARELHTLLSNNFSVYKDVKSELIGEDLGLIEKVLKPVDDERTEDMRRYEASAAVLCAFLESDLWRATIRSYRTDDDSSHDAEHVIDLLYGFERATDGLGQSTSGTRFFERAAVAGIVYSGRDDFISDYVFPVKKPVGKTLSHLRTGLGAVLPIYARLFPTLEVPEIHFRHELLKKNLSVFAGEEFEMIQRLPKLVDDGFFITTKTGKGPIPGKWISRQDLKKIQNKVEKETKRRKANFKHGKARTILNRAGLALHAINLGIAEADFQQQLVNGQVSLKGKVDRTMARVSFSLTLAGEYAELVLGKSSTSKAVFVGRLAKAGAIPGIYFAVSDIAAGAKGFSSGNYALGVGNVLNGFVGLAGAIAVLAGLTGIGLVAVVISLLGSVLVASATKTEIEEFFHHCEWGKQSVGRMGQGKYSEHEFFRWGGKLDVQRDALYRILCQFSGHARTNKGAVELVTNFGNYGPNSNMVVQWDCTLMDGTKKKKEQSLHAKALEGKRKAVAHVRDFEKEGRINHLEAKITLDLHGDGSLMIPKKGLKVLLMEGGLVTSGTARSLDIQE